MASDLHRRRFYVLGPKRGSSADTEFFKVEPILRGDAPQCPTCGRFLGMRRWLAPRRAQIVIQGEVAGDFAFASSSEFLVSERVKEAVQEVEITSTLRAAPAAPARYFHVEIVQQAANLDDRRSEVERTSEPDCGECLSDGVAAIRGFALDPASWSGADALVARGLPGVVVASERFHEIAMKYEFSNLDLIPTETFGWDPAATR